MNRKDEHMVEHSLDDLEKVTGGTRHIPKPIGHNDPSKHSEELAQIPKIPLTHTTPKAVPEQSKREKVKKL